MKTKITSAPELFHKLLAGQKTVGNDARWLQFGGSRPGIMPAGTDGSTKDVTIYDNAVVVAESGGKHVQLQLGTLVRAGDTWRLIGPPQIEGEGEPNAVAGMLGPARTADREDENAAGGAGGPPQKLLGRLEELDKKYDDAADPKEQADIAAQKAVVLQEIAGLVTTPEDRGAVGPPGG